MTAPAVSEDFSLSDIRTQLTEPSLDFEHFTAICARIGQMYATVKKAEGELLFVVGDAILAGEALYGQRAYQSFEEFGLSEEVLRECARVSQRVPRSLRRTQDGLSWSHHRAVAPMEIPEQEKWLERAVQEHLSHSNLRLALRNGQEPAVREYCPTCHRPL